MKINLEALAKYGYVEFKCDFPNQNSISIANEIGDISEFPGISNVQTLVPSEIETKEKSSYSGQFGMGEFPFHTDMAHWFQPPRFIFLRCVQPSRLVETKIVCANDVFEEKDTELISRALFRPRRRLDGHLSLLRIREKWGFRWDRVFLQPLSKSAFTAKALIEKRISEATTHSVTLDHPCACVLIDNWNAFHGRSAIPPSEKSRILERVYISNLKGLQDANH